MIRVSPLAVLLLVACGPQQRVPQCSPSSTRGDKTAVVVVLEGAPAEIEMLLPPAVFCQDGNPVANAVGTEILSASNTSIAHTFTPPTSSDTRGYTTMVTFTPPAPGVYFITARFEPSLGVARRLVQVLADRTAEVPALRIPNAMPCDEVAGLTERAVCRRGQEVSVLHDGGVDFSELGVLGLACSQGTAWWWTSSTLTRAVEVDGGLARSTIALPFAPGSLSVSADSLVRASAEAIEVTVQGDGGLISTTRTLPVAGAAPGASRSGSVLGIATPTQLCAIGDEQPDASVRCVDSSGLVGAASEGDVIWLRGAETGIIGIARVTSATRDPEVHFLEAQADSMIDTKVAFPAFSWNGKFLSVRRDLTLEAWQPPPALVKRSVTQDFVVFQTREEIVLFRR
ncbi:MAG: hypothetical protein QM817_33715 [Archangium sp.]